MKEFAKFNLKNICQIIAASLIYVMPCLCLTYFRKKSPTSKREDAITPVEVRDEFRLGVA
jgi:hypothetical protein